MEARVAVTRATIVEKALTTAIDNNLSKNDPFIVKTTLATHPGIAVKLVCKIYNNTFVLTMLSKLYIG
jgi:hypothetical protein